MISCLKPVHELDGFFLYICNALSKHITSIFTGITVRKRARHKINQKRAGGNVNY